MKDNVRLLISGVLLLASAAFLMTKVTQIALNFSASHRLVVPLAGIEKPNDDSLPKVSTSHVLARLSTVHTVRDIALDFSVPDTPTRSPNVTIQASRSPAAVPSAPPLEVDVDSSPTPPATLPSVTSITKPDIDSWAPNLKMTPKPGDVVAGYLVTSPYGKRVHPITGQEEFHGGVDLATTMNTKLYALAKPGSSTILKCWVDVKGGGLVASMRSPSFPNLQFDALHLSSCKATTNGPWIKVASGEVIAETGSSGMSTGPHLHFQVRDLTSGRRISPAKGFVSLLLTGQPNTLS